MKKYLITILLILPAFAVSAQDLSLYQKKYFVAAGDTMPYRLLLPENFNPKKAYPLILFLHGAGERGSDNEKQLVHGGKLFLKDSIRKNYPAIVLFPQCMANSYWSNVAFQFDSTGKRLAFLFKTDSAPTKAMQMAIELIKSMMSEFTIQKNKIYVGGLSMGGMGTFEIVRRMPGTFAAAFAICGGANPESAPAIKNTAWWIFHGLKDDVVNPKYSIGMANALKAAGADILLTLYPNANHNSWDSAFAEPGLLAWLWAHQLK